MNRDVDLERKILFAIEGQYKPGDGYIFCLNIDGYDMRTVAEHCDFLTQEGLVNFYKPVRGGDTIVTFQVGNISAKGYDFLNSVRDDEMWEKVKAKADAEKLPKTVGTLSRIAGIIIGNALKEISGG